jgi:hypothetical protein
MNDWLILVLLIAGTYRLTRLVVKDDFPPIQWARDKIRNTRPAVYTGPFVDPMMDPERAANYRWWWLGELVSCHWCASAYIAAGTVGFTLIWVWLPLPVLWWLAVWAGAAVIADRL